MKCMNLLVLSDRVPCCCQGPAQDLHYFHCLNFSLVLALDVLVVFIVVVVDVVVVDVDDVVERSHVSWLHLSNTFFSILLVVTVNLKYKIHLSHGP